MRRSTLRWIALVAAGVTLLGLAALTLFRAHGAREVDRAAQRFEFAIGPLDFEAYRPDDVADHDNAALPVLEANDRIERLKQDLFAEITALRLASRRPASSWTPEEWQRAHSLLTEDEVGSVLETLHRATGRAGSSFRLDYAKGAEMEIPNLLHAILAADLLFAEARVAWHDGRTEDGVAAVETQAALTRALKGEAPLIFQLVARGTEMAQYRAIRDALATGITDPQRLAELRATTAERPRADSLRGPLGAEGAFLYSVRPGGRLARAAVDDRPWSEGLRHRWLGHHSIAAGLDYYVRTAEAFPRLTAAELAGDRLSPPRGQSGQLVPDLRPTLETFKATESLRRLSRTALDLAAEGAESGSLPETLPAATEPDPFTGRPPVYRRAADGSATLTVPGAEELWWSIRPGRIGKEDEAALFTWSLAPPAGGASPTG